MHAFYAVRKGRQAAVQALSPFIASSRRTLCGIPDEVWLDPYVIGLICTVITWVAKREAYPLGTQALSRVQLQAWSEVTGLQPELVGEEISYLSTTRSGHFLSGCQRGVEFSAALARASGHSFATGSEESAWVTDMLGGHVSSALEELASVQGATPHELWSAYFDAVVAEKSKVEARAIL